MRHAYCGLAILLLLPAMTRAEELSIDNESPRPFVYQVRKDAGTWSEPISLASGSRRAYSASLPLVVRYRDGESWTTYRLPPGRSFRVQPDAKGSDRLFDVGEVRDPLMPHRLPDHDALDDTAVRDTRPARADARFREIKVLCLADKSYRRRFPEWKERIGEIVSRASRDFEAAFALKFTITDRRAWDYEARNVGDPQEHMTRLAAIDPAPADLAVAFLGAVQTTGAGRYGHRRYEDVWSVPFGQHVAVADIRKEQAFGAEQLLVRGLCGVFGAFYVADRHSVMNGLLENVQPGPVRFGEVTQEVISLTRDFDFGGGPASLPPETVARIKALYARYRHAGSEPGDDPVTNGYKAREPDGDRRRSEHDRTADSRNASAPRSSSAP
jgi:hypothetical protein